MVSFQRAATSGLTQQQFAHRLSASPGFVSDIARGVKRPGAEFLLRLRESFGISIDWLLDGSGTISGESSIRIDSFQLNAAQSALAVAARVHGDPAAATLLQDFLTGRKHGSNLLEGLEGRLAPLVEQSAVGVMAAVMYNTQLFVPEGRQRFLGGLQTAITLCDAYLGPSSAHKLSARFAAATA